MKTKPTKKNGDYLIRDFPDELKAKAQHKAIDEKISLRELILKALAKYLE